MMLSNFLEISEVILNFAFDSFGFHTQGQELLILDLNSTGL